MTAASQGHRADACARFYDAFCLGLCPSLVISSQSLVGL
jgi:hypothetical protein